ncbi:unnamed protein product [Mytilus coruscus]|uniref:Uncharacterized protein n=1 Tax=Mytilus coruscus TaxID=42192 RepID=A0A6J8ETN8_MYTCO|nr:unnamed protein product [Mytilus coruscus]
MNSKKNAGTGKKRKKSRGQNDSNEKPSKLQQNSTHSQTENVNKQKTIKNPVDQTLKSMNTYCVSPNIQGMQQMQANHIPQQNFQNFNPRSPDLFTGPTYATSPISNMMQPIVQSTMNQGVDKIDVLTQKVDQMFQKLSTLDNLNDKLSKFETTMNTFVKNVDKITKRMNDFEKGMEFMNDKFESSKKERENLTTSVSKLQTEHDDMIQDVGQLQRDFDQLFERHLDLQTRTMRENLVFTGIPLSDSFETEDTEALISRFMANEMKMDPPMEFHRAHRFGKDSVVKNRDGTTLFKTRPIVCRFKNFKDREAVRSAASELKGTRFGVNEQYPKEINDRRKSLWPFFKEAKKQKRKANFKKDKLFIDGVEFIPPVDNRMETNERQLYIGQGARPKNTGKPRQNESSRREPQNDHP